MNADEVVKSPGWLLYTSEQDFFGRINAPLRPVNNKVIVPDEAEIERNPRSRSAKLRIAEKV